jgi:hypothetical protein
MRCSARLPRGLFKQESGGRAGTVAHDLASRGAGKAFDELQHRSVDDARVLVHPVRHARDVAGGVEPRVRRSLAAPVGFVPAEGAQPAPGCERACGAADGVLEIRARAHRGEIELRERVRAEREVEVRVDEPGRHHAARGERDGGDTGRRGGVEGSDAAGVQEHRICPGARRIRGPEARAGHADARGELVVRGVHRMRFGARLSYEP